MFWNHWRIVLSDGMTWLTLTPNILRQGYVTGVCGGNWKCMTDVHWSDRHQCCCCCCFIVCVASCVIQLLLLLLPVMWSETVGLRTRPVWDQKIGLGLGLGLAHCGLGLGFGLAVLVLFCETRSCNIRRHNDLEGHINFSSTVLFIVSLFCAWKITTMEINGGVQLLKS